MSDIADPSSMQDACHNELSRYDLARRQSPSSSVVRTPDRCMGGHGLFVPRSWQTEYFSFLSELKIYHLSFFIITHSAFDIADPSSMQDAGHNELSKYDLARHKSPSSSVVRAPDRCTGGIGLEFVPRSWQTEYSISLMS